MTHGVSMFAPEPSEESMKLAAVYRKLCQFSGESYLSGDVRVPQEASLRRAVVGSSTRLWCHVPFRLSKSGRSTVYQTNTPPTAAINSA